MAHTTARAREAALSLGHGSTYDAARGAMLPTIRQGITCSRVTGIRAASGCQVQGAELTRSDLLAVGQPCQQVIQAAGDVNMLDGNDLVDDQLSQAPLEQRDSLTASSISPSAAR